MDRVFNAMDEAEGAPDMDDRKPFEEESDDLDSGDGDHHDEKSGQARNDLMGLKEECLSLS